MEKKIKRSGRPSVGRIKARRKAKKLIINSTIRILVHNYPPHYAVLWIQLFDEFGINPIIPSRAPPKRRYNLTVSMLRLAGYGLAEELEETRTYKTGRPAKQYRLIIPQNPH